LQGSEHDMHNVTFGL